MRAGAIHDGVRKDYGHLMGLVMGGMSVREAAGVVGLSWSWCRTVVRRERRAREVRSRFGG